MRMTLYEVDMEDMRDPYGCGIGFTVLVLTTSEKKAKYLASNKWGRQKEYVWYKPYRVRLAKCIYEGNR